jgi:hypothetical protein
VRDANIEDLDLSRVACNALTNMCEENVKHLWTNDHVGKLDEILSSLGEELDSIIEVANDSEKEEILFLRRATNDLINSMPEIMYPCPEDGN